MLSLHGHEVITKSSKCHSTSLSMSVLQRHCVWLLVTVCVCVSVYDGSSSRENGIYLIREYPRKDGIKMKRQNIKMVIKASSFEPRWYQSHQIQKTSSRHHKILIKWGKMLSTQGYKDIIEIIQDRQSAQKAYNRRDIRHQSEVSFSHHFSSQLHQSVRNAIASTIPTPH